MQKEVFSPMAIDAIGEMMNISLGSSATAVSNMLNHRVDITTPTVIVIDKEDLSIRNIEPAMGVEIKYVSGLSGSNLMLLKKSDIKVIVDILMGSETPDEEFELNELTISAVCEVMNQMMGAAATALSDFLGYAVNISTPLPFELDDMEKFKREHIPQDANTLVVVQFSLKIEGAMESEFMNVMSVDLARELLKGLGLESEVSGGEDAAAPAEPAPAPQPEPAGGGDRKLSQEEIERMMQASAAPAAPAPEPEPAGGGDRKLSQEEIERMMQANTAPAPTPTPEPEPAGGGDRKLSQEEIERMMQANAAPAAPAPAPAASAPATAPAAAAQQTAMPPQMMQPPMPGADGMSFANGQMGYPPMYYPPYPYPYPYPPQEAPAPAPEPKVISTKPLHVPEMDLEEKIGKEQAQNLELVMEVPLQIAVEIGRTRRKVQDILAFSKGSLVVLDKLAGDQVDVLVNGKHIAKGDVVVVDDNFGVRITEIVQNEAMEALK